MSGLDLFAKRLSLFMTEQSVNDYELADMTDIARPQLTRIRNAQGNPTLSTLERIAKALGRPLNDFFKEEIIIDKQSEYIRLYQNADDVTKETVLNLLRPNVSQKERKSSS